jgi:MFS family permease
VSETSAPSVYRFAGFRWLWAGQGISQFGSQITGLAIPVLAVTILHAAAWELGILNAAETAAFLLVGLPAGAWVDRWLKRRVMIAADLVRAVMIAAIPVLWFTGLLAMWQVYVIATVVGVATVFFDVSYQSYIPILVKSRQVGPANSALEATSQVSQIGGPAIAGVLLTFLKAPVLLLADAATFLFSAFALWRIRDHEMPASKENRQPLVREIAEGMRFVWHQKLIRSITGTTAASNLFSTLVYTLLPLYVLKTLDLGSAGLGIMFTFGAVGGLLGALATPWLARKIGGGNLIVASAFLGGVATALIPLAAGLTGFAALVLLIGSQFLTSIAVLVYNISQVTMRQQLCPPRLLGRMNASIRFVVWGVMPIAALLAGLLGSTIGVVPTMWIATVGGILAGGFVLFSPLTGMRELPSELVADAKAEAAGGPDSAPPAESGPVRN